jgi:proton-dependent oligopeptide transporter, POT family
VAEKLRHPKGLFLLFFTEMWERFSFYGMQAVFYLYMINALTFDKTFADLIYGNYTGMVYITALIGGFLSDRYMGNRKSIVTGGIIMAVGQFLLFTSGMLYTNKPYAAFFLYAGLILLCLGNGFFKPNISSMVGQLYPENDKRIDSAFTIFYMGINIGGLLAPIICGFVGNTGNLADFKWGYLAAGIGMLLSLVVFIPLKNKYVVTPEGKPIGIVPPYKSSGRDSNSGSGSGSGRKVRNITRNLAFFVIVFVLFFFVFKTDTIGSFIYATFFTAPLSIILDKSLSKIEKQKIIAMFILIVFTMIFWIAFGEIGSSLTYFADKQLDRSIFGWQMPPAVFQAFGPLFIVSFAPIMAVIWTFLAKKNTEPSIPFKLALGLLFMCLAYLILALAVKLLDPTVKTGMQWLIIMYFVLTIGELSLSPIGLSMMVKLAPIRFGSVLMSVWFLSLGTSFKLSGVLSTFYPHDDIKPIFLGMQIATTYDFFMIFVVFTGVSAILLFLLIKPLLKLMNGIR